MPKRSSELVVDAIRDAERQHYDEMARGGIPRSQVETWRSYDSKAARTRSEKLLRAVCTDDELRDWDRARYVWVRGPVTKRWYSISYSTIAAWTTVGETNSPPDEPQIMQFDGTRCIIRDPNWGMTHVDLIISKKLLIQYTEVQFLRLCRDYEALRRFGIRV